MTSELARVPAADRWSRQARRVLLLAGEVGIPVRADLLLSWDMRDLVSLDWVLEELLAERAGWQARRKARARLRQLR